MSAVFVVLFVILIGNKKNRGELEYVRKVCRADVIITPVEDPKSNEAIRLTDEVYFEHMAAFNKQ